MSTMYFSGIEKDMSRCPYLLAIEERKTKCIVSAHCKNASLTNGWCEMHQYCADVLKRLRGIDYARLSINELLEIGGTYEDWYSYLVTLPAPDVEFGRARINRYQQLLRAIAEEESARIDKTRAQKDVGHDSMDYSHGLFA